MMNFESLNIYNGFFRPFFVYGIEIKDQVILFFFS